MPEPQRHLGFRFLSRFRCLAAACEETCCVGWSVPVDEEHYAAIRAAMSGSEAERAEFERVFVPEPEPDSNPGTKRRTAALAVIRPDRSCSLLDEDRLCSLQRRYGESVLPDICAAYPRVASRVRERIEVAGSLSCPEMARLGLLAEDATELTELDPAALGRLRMFYELEQPQNLYEAAFDDVRSLEMFLLAQRQFPMRSRLFFLALLAQKSGPFLRPEGDREAGLRLHRLLSEVRRQEGLEQLHRQFSAIELDNPFALSVVTQLLPAAWSAELPGFRKMLAEVLAAYAADPESGVQLAPSGAPSFEPNLLHAAFKRRSAVLPPQLEQRMDLYFENFCTNFFFKDWYLRSPSLLRHVMGLLVRVATVRFLLLSHPAVVALEESDSALSAKQEVLDRAAVQVFYTVARALDHAEPLMSAVHESLAAQQMETLNHAMCLIKL